jgi:acetolactate synthase-1/2/3 large subunit
MTEHMNGAQALIRTLVDAGVDTCFMNPGTSEMHFVAALDSVPEMHSVLALFEGVATGAADGYARMAGRLARCCCTWDPGSATASQPAQRRRGRTPIVNISGDHATYHAKYDAPLQSDIAAIASGVSTWIRSSTDPAAVAQDAADAVAAAMGPPGQVATLILPADVCWLEAPGPVAPVDPAARSAVPTSTVEEVAAVLRSGEASRPC